MTPSDEKLYAELCEGWRYFATWREKAFAGYLAILGALGFGFAKTDSPAIRALILAACILACFVFWIIDRRTVELLSRCLRSAAKLEDSAGIGKTMVTRPSGIISLGFAISLLVAAVAGVAFVGCCVFVARWRSEATFSPWQPGTAAVIFALLFLVFRAVDRQRRKSLERSDPLAGSASGD